MCLDRTAATVAAASAAVPRNIGVAPSASEANPAAAGPSTLPAATARSTAVKLCDGRAGKSRSDQNARTALVIMTLTP